MKVLTFKTSRKTEALNITQPLQQVVAQSGIQNGVLTIYVPHTTAGIAINEAADPSVIADIMATLARLVPDEGRYSHLEGNSPAHIKVVLTGTSQNIPIDNGGLALGTWQGIFLMEFDGPRTRQVYTQITPS